MIHTILPVFHYDLTCLILISIATCLQVPPTHLNSIPWRLQLLVQTKDAPRLFIPISPDYSCLTTIYLQWPFLPPHFQLPVDPSSGVASIPLALSHSPSQPVIPPILILLCASPTCRNILYQVTHSHHTFLKSRNGNRNQGTKETSQQRQDQISPRIIQTILTPDT